MPIKKQQHHQQPQPQQQQQQQQHHHQQHHHHHHHQQQQQQQQQQHLQSQEQQQLHQQPIAVNGASSSVADTLLQTSQDRSQSTKSDTVQNRKARRNVALTNSNRKRICEKRRLNPDMTLDALGAWAMDEFSLTRKPAMGTLSRILNKESRYYNMTDTELQSQRKRAVLCRELEHALVEWVNECRRQHVHVSYKMITARAKDIASYIKTLPGQESSHMPAFSNGWVSGFTKRHSFIGQALNGPGVEALASTQGDEVFDRLPVFTTMQQLVEQAFEACAIEREREEREEMDNGMSYHRMNRMEEDMITESDMEGVVSGSPSDLHLQVVRAVKQGAQSFAASSSTSSTSGSTPVINLPSRRRRDHSQARRPHHGAAHEGTPSAEEQPLEISSPLQQATQHHRIHPAAQGMIPQARSVDRLSPVTPPNGLSSPFASQSFQSSQQQQHSAEFTQQTLLQAETTASGSDTEDIRSAIAAAAAAAGSSSNSARPAPTTAEALAAVRVVIDALNVNVPADVELFRPLIDMERRLQEKIHTNDRQANLMNWVR